MPSYVLSDAQKAVKATQDSKRYYEKKEYLIKQKAIKLEKKIQDEIIRKQEIRLAKIQRLNKNKIKPAVDDILINEIINFQRSSS